MKQRPILILLTLCILLTMLPAALAAGSMTPLDGINLYKVDQRDSKSHWSVIAPDIWNNWNAPYRLSPGGAIQGEIPWGTVLEATASDGTWLKVKYGGRDCYVYQAKLSKVNQPDIVCSPWAKERLSYYNGYIGTKDVWPNAVNDWTKPITRADMAEMLFLLFRNGGAPYEDAMPFYKERHFTDLEFNQKINGVNIGAAAHFLASMGVIPSGGNFNAAASVTYAEFTDALIKLSAYTDKYFHDDNRGSLTAADIQKFAIGGDTSANAGITKEQAKILCDASKCWDTERYWQAFETQRGGTLLHPGVFVIDVSLGKYPRQPHLVIGADGKGELSNTIMQKFKVSYKKTLPAVEAQNASLSRPMMLFAIQTEAGKYLALEGLPSNGRRLITRDSEFLWWIDSSANSLTQTATIKVPGFYDQYLNASGQSSKDGTHIITWYKENKWKAKSDPNYPHNTEFNFYMVHGANSNTPSVAATLRHGPNLVAYPVKTSYKVGEGFDSTGFKAAYLDLNNEGKITDISEDYYFYTSNGNKLTQGQPFTTVGTRIVEIKDDARTLGRYFITVTGDTAVQTVVRPAAPKKHEQPKPRLASGLRIQALPQKTSFRIGENFDITGAKAVYNERGIKRADDKSTNVTDKLTYRYSEDGVNFVQLKPGQPIPFTSAGKEMIEVQYEGITKTFYWITITK